MGFRLTEEDKKLINSVKLSHSSPTNNDWAVTASYNAISLNGGTEKVPAVLSLNISARPTANCQMGSIRSFYSMLSHFQGIEDKTMSKVSKTYNRERVIVYLLMYRHLITKVTNKRLYFIDIRENYISMFRKVHQIFAKKSYKKNQNVYKSTNGNKLMYTILHFDRDKLEALFAGTQTANEIAEIKRKKEIAEQKEAVGQAIAYNMGSFI